MANVILAKTAGFCWGVKRAIDITLETADGKSEPTFTYGPLIHNPQLINLLESKNIRVKTDLDAISGGELIIRTHGITPQQRSLIKERGITIKDATCPLVARVQGMIKKCSYRGYAIVIVGDQEHPEVVGLKGFAVTPVHVISSPEDVKGLPKQYEKVFVCAQTTCGIGNYGRTLEKLRGLYKNLEVGETICDATTERQTEVIELTKQVDALVVVGGRESANTARLASIAREEGLPVWHVESESELDLETLGEFDSIGVTAGASTPKWVIDNVVVKLKQMDSSSRGPASFTQLLRFLIKSEIYLSLGATALTYVNMKVMGVPLSPTPLAISFCAILSTYLLNQIFLPDELRKSNLRKYGYHLKYADFFKYLAISAGVVGVFLSFNAGIEIFGIYLLLILLGSTYGVNRPFFERMLGPFSKLSRIPASKDILAGFAWGIVTVAIPYIAAGNGKSFLLPFIFTFGIVYVRAVLLDLQDIYSDQIVGKEVLPMLTGSKRAIYTLYLVLFLEITVWLTAVISKGMAFGLMFPYLLGVLYLLGFIRYHQNGAPSIRFNLYLDSGYLAMALAAFILS